MMPGAVGRTRLLPIHPNEDNHSDPSGFQYERDEFFAGMIDSGFLEDQNFYIITGDRALAVPLDPPHRLRRVLDRSARGWQFSAREESRRPGIN